MGEDVVGILKTLIVGDIKAFGLMANNFNLMAEQATLLALGRGGLPGLLGGLATASHTPNANPYDVPTSTAKA